MFEQPEWETKTLISRWRELCQQMNPYVDYNSSWQRMAQQYGRRSKESSLSIHRIVPARLAELDSVRNGLNRPAELELTVWLTSAPYRNSSVYDERGAFANKRGVFANEIFGLMSLRTVYINQTRRFLAVAGKPSTQASNDERFLHDITNQYLALPQERCWNIITALQREDGVGDGQEFWREYFRNLEGFKSVGTTLMKEESIFLTRPFHIKYGQFAKWNIERLRQQELVLTGNIEKVESEATQPTEGTSLVS
jgi:hypothetical protein